jgi:hypothetical protein
MNSKLPRLAACAALWIAAGAAQAALTPTAPSCSATVTNASWSDCAGAFLGNDKNQQSDVAATIAAEFGLLGAVYQGASDDSGHGLFSNAPVAGSGTLNFDFAIDSPFVLSLKAGNAFSLFYFDGAAAPISSISYSTLGVSVNGQGIARGLSHASVYAPTVVPAVPEPETYALMLAGLALTVFLAKRRPAPQA